MRVNESDPDLIIPLNRFHFREIFLRKPPERASSVHRAIKYAAASACANTYFIV